jgi:hypothetical protein
MKTPWWQNESRLRLLEIIALMLIVVIAAQLRLENVGIIPGWYTDEAVHIDIARHMLTGDIRFMAVQDSTLLFARLPLYPALVAGALSITGMDTPFTTLRTVSGLLGVACVLLVYAIARPHGRWLALLAAGALAVFPQAILYNRIAYSYNLVAPLLLLITLGLDRASTRRTEGNRLRTEHSQQTAANTVLSPSPFFSPWLLLSGLALGLALVTDVIALTFVPPFLLLGLRRWRALIPALLVAAIPPLLYAAWMFSSAPAAFQYDLQHTFGRLGGVGLLEQVLSLVANIQLLAEDGWWLLGCAGLFTLPRSLRYVLAFLFLIPIISIARAYSFIGLGAYYAIPLLPILAFGIAGVVHTGVQMVYSYERNRWGSRKVARYPLSLLTSASVIFVLVFMPVLSTIRIVAYYNNTGYTTTFDALLMSPYDTQQVAEFLRPRIREDDVIVTTPVLGALIPGNPIDFQQSVAFSSRINTPHLPADLPAERLAFNPDYRAARFVVIDDNWRAWGVYNVTGLADIVADVETNWQQIYAVGGYTVWERPAR